MKRWFIAVAIAVFVVGVVTAAIEVTRPSEKQLTVTAQFEDTIGLYEGNAVSVLGMQVGRVTSIESKGAYVEVKMLIASGVDIPADVQAVTVSTSILTDRHIELTPAYRGGPKLKNGDMLGLGRTRTPVEFDRSLAMVDRLARSLGGDGQGQGPLADLVGVSSAIATGSGADIKTTLDQLAQALRLGSEHGAQSKKDIQSIVTKTADLMQAASDNDGAIREFGSSLHQISDTLAAQNIGSGDTGRKITQILEQTASLLENNRQEFTSTFKNAQTLTTAINDYRRGVAEVVDVSPLMADNVYNAIDSNAGSLRLHIMPDKLLFNGQFTKEVCNLLQLKQLGCATGTMLDYGPDFGLGPMLDLMAGMGPK